MAAGGPRGKNLPSHRLANVRKKRMHHTLAVVIATHELCVLALALVHSVTEASPGDH